MFSLYVQNKNSNNIIHVFRPIYIIDRILGLFPFSVNFDQSLQLNKPFISKVDFILFVLHISTYGGFAFFNIYTYTGKYVKLSTVLEIGNRVILIGGLSTGFGVVVIGLLNRNNLCKIFQKLESFDQEIRTAPIPINYNEQRKYVRKYLSFWGLLTVIFVIYSTIIYLNYFSVLQFTALVSSYTFSNGVFTAVLSTYAFFLYNLRIRYNVLNQNLKYLFSTPELAISIKHFGSTDEIINRLKLYADLHNMLSDVVEIVNCCYSKQVMLYTGACFSFTVLTLFGLYNMWFLVYTDPQFQIATVFTAWAFYYNCFVMCVLSSGGSLRSEGEHTGVIIHKYINKSNNRVIIDRLMTFSQQTLHRIPEATCKLFAFDWSTLFSLVSATVTYLIILIQFDTSRQRVKLDSHDENEHAK